MGGYTTPPNEELVLTGYLRGRLRPSWPDVYVSNRLTVRPDGTEVAPDHDFAVIVRSDGGPAGAPPTHLRRFGVRIFGPDGDDNHIRTSELGRRLVPLLYQAWDWVPVVADTVSVAGPHRVPASVGRPEMYLTAEMILLGTPTT